MGILEDNVKKTDDMLHRFSSFLLDLKPRDEESGNFYHVITAIGESTKTNYATLRNAFSIDEQVLLAWSCRNLLELAVYAEFVICSKKNMKDFAADRFIDGKEIACSLKEISLLLDSHADTSGLDALIADFTDKIKGEDSTRERFLRTEDLAKHTKIGQEEFKRVNKLCSKFVHPTAWSLLTADIGSVRFPDAKEILYIIGAYYFARICAAFMPHIRKFGLTHKCSE